MEKPIAFAFSVCFALLTASFRPSVGYVLRADNSHAAPVGSRDYRRQREDAPAAPATLSLKTDQQPEVNEDHEESNENYIVNGDQVFDRPPVDRKYQSIGSNYDGVPEAVGRNDGKYLRQNADQDVGLAAWRKLGGNDQRDSQNLMNRKRVHVDGKSESNERQSTVNEDGDDFRGQTGCDVSNRHRVTSKLQQQLLQRQPSQKRRYAEDRARQTVRNKSRPSWTFDDFDDLRGRRRR